MSQERGYYRHPTIHGDTIVFVCEDDLWSVGLEGGIARRLTSNPGSSSFPVFSPDGKQIAFTGRDEGPSEVYVMDADGGPINRMTWLGSLTRAVAWSGDAKSIIFSSSYGQPIRHGDQLYSMPSQGGPHKQIIPGPARAISHNPKGKGVVIGRNSGDPARWKRYRGGTAGTLWIDRTGSGNFRPLIELKGNLAAPMWIGSRIYFLSDHEGHGNIYSCTADGKNLKRHTHHEDFYARFPATDGKHIVYHAGSDIWVYDIKADATRKVPIRIHSTQPQLNRKFLSAPSQLEDFDVHPKGHSLALTARGGLFSTPCWGGAPTRHGETSSVRYRLARWLPDGKRMVAVHDEGGEEALVIVESGKRSKTIKVDIGRAVDMHVAPTGVDRVAITNNRYEVILVNLATSRSKVIDHGVYDRIKGLAWSPDGQWLAYALGTTPRSCGIRLFNTKTNATTQLTREDFNDFAPAFDPSGKYLYFLSNRFFEPVMDSQNFDYVFPVATRPCLIPLSKDTPSPFVSAQRAVRGPGEDGSDDKAGEKKKPAKKSAKDKKKGTPEPVAIDLTGIEDRVIAFPVPLGEYHSILGIEGKVLYSSSQPIPSADDDEDDDTHSQTLHSYDLENEKSEVFVDDVDDFKVSVNGKMLGIETSSRLRVLATSGLSKGSLSSSDKASRESGWVDLSSLSVEVVPRDEWRQMFREAWRLQRDQFWTQDMAGINWKSVHDRYLPLVDRCASRTEFSDLMWELQGELGTSHCYEMGGDYRPEPRYYQGFLGVDIAHRAGKWVIARIPRGDSWSTSSSSPLADPSLNVKVGEEIVAIDGKKLSRQLSPYECLTNRVGKNVSLTLRTTRGSRSTTRDIAVRTLGYEALLRYRDWVEANRAAVHKATRGRVGYLHIPDMGGFGYTEFNRYFPREVEKQGLIIDVRYNGGGHVSQLILQRLLRKRIGYDINRWGKPMSYPTDAPMGPMVALTNEHAGSDGDMFSHAFKLYKLGPLIGKRTWGGVVGIWPRHALVDGTVTTQPEFSFWFQDVGWNIENYGTDPDIEVEITPQDYAAKRDTQLERGISEVEKLIKKLKPQIPAFERRPELKAPKLPPLSGRKQKS